MVGEVHPVDHERHQVQPSQVRGQQVGQGGLGHRHELPRHRRLAGRLPVSLNLLTDGLQRDRKAAVDTAASIRSTAIRPSSSVEVNNS